MTTLGKVRVLAFEKHRYPTKRATKGSAVVPRISKSVNKNTFFLPAPESLDALRVAGAAVRP